MPKTSHRRYQHTQVGYLIIAAVGVGSLFGLYLMTELGFHWIAVTGLVILVVSLALFTTLTVEIDEDALDVRFGPGLIRKRFLLKDIASSRVVKNRWYYGWGIRWTPHGSLYNVSGLHAVELEMTTGRRFRIGTDVPAELDQAIRQSIVRARQ